MQFSGGSRTARLGVLEQHMQEIDHVDSSLQLLRLVVRTFVEPVRKINPSGSAMTREGSQLAY